MGDERVGDDSSKEQSTTSGQTSRTQTGVGQRQRTGTGNKRVLPSRDRTGTRGTQRTVPATPLTDRVPTRGSMRKGHTHSHDGTDPPGSRVQTGSKVTRGGTRIHSHLSSKSKVVQEAPEEHSHVGQSDRTTISSRAASMLRAPNLQRAKSDLIRETVAELQQDLEPFLHPNRKEASPEKGSEFYDTDCESDFTPTPEADDGRRQYDVTCEKLGVSPIEMVRRQFHRKHMKIFNQGMNERDLLSLCSTLLENHRVRHLTLDGNRFGDRGAEYVSALLSDDNCDITHVILNNNLIGSKGLSSIAGMFEENNKISSLSLSGNLLRDQDAFNLAAILKITKVLTSLDLSHNHLGNDACLLLGSGIGANDSIRTLNLSWNKIRPPGGKSIALGLKENVVLKTLNVAMNGFSQEGAEALGLAFRTNSTLTDLDLSHNRVPDFGVMGLAKGLQHNEGLVVLKLHNNPVTSGGAMALLTALKRNENSAIKTLDLSTIHIPKDGVEMLEELRLRWSGFKVQYGGTVISISTVKEKQQELDKYRNPLSILKEYMEGEGLRLVDFFKQFDKDGGGSISREEFMKGLQSTNVPLTQAQLDELITTLDKDGDGEVDYGELVQGEREYRQQMRRKMGTKLNT